MAHAPVFIHSLFRSASTYFFDKFRRLGTGFTCYQEPFNEILAALNDPRRQEELLVPPEYEALRHPVLDRPYFYEFWCMRERLQGLFHESFSYERYFLSPGGALSDAEHTYIATLIAQAPGRAVLQFCRSAGRIAALRQVFGGLHIHLWREPRTQWWSYKIADYFDKASQRIYFSPTLPPALHALAATAGITPGRLRQRPAQHNYRLFYGLWLDAWLRLQAHAQMDIGIDIAATSPAAAQRITRELDARLGCPIDLTDLRARGMSFTPAERDFYAGVEAQVGAVFVANGHCVRSQLAAAETAAATARAAHGHAADDVTTQGNLRRAALAMMDRLAEAERPRSRWRRPSIPYLAKWRSYL